MTATEPFSAREKHLLRCFITGMSHVEIAKNMGISHKTVAVHLYNIRAKIGKDVDTDVRLYKWVTDNKKDLK
jgi:DNA-binding CsgD family transcriptional regulator